MHRIHLLLEEKEIKTKKEIVQLDNHCMFTYSISQNTEMFSVKHMGLSWWSTYSSFKAKRDWKGQ